MKTLSRFYLLSTFRKLRNEFSFVSARYITEDLDPNVPKPFNPFKKKPSRYENEMYNVNRLCLTIIGNGSFGQPRCVALFTDIKGFLFNCGEGVGRLCREHEVNITLLRHVFITQKSWKNLSGLPDIYLTNETYGVRRMTLYGPPGVELFTSLISSQTPDIHLRKKSSYIDDILEITYIPVKNTCFASNWKRYSKRSLKKEREGDVAFNYVCKINERLGEFNPEKCIEIGIPIGPHLLKLKNGEDVVLPSGRIIYSSDVLDAPQPRMIFLVVDCPSENFLDAFVYESQFNEYQVPAICASEVVAIFHYSPLHIIKLQKYQEWMQKFHQDVEHYFLNSRSPSLSSVAVHQTQSILHQLHPEIFRLFPKEEKASPLHLSVSSKIVFPPPMFQIHILPEKKLNWCNVVNNDFNECNQMIKDVPGFNHELEKLKSLVSSHPTSKERNEYPEVLFLGTSSATSTAYRNVSAILVNLNSHKSILLDCGESTVNQLVRYFGMPEVNSILRRISCVFITHLHTDHYMGLFEFVKARIESFENAGLSYQPLALLLPSRIIQIFYRFCDIFEPIRSKVRIFTCNFFTSENGHHEKLEAYLGDVKFETVPVKHCLDAYGAVLQLHSQWKIVYSGDTAPCQSLIDAGENCTLLIHEATIEDNLISEATSKTHSTPSQVVEIAEKMNAKYAIMTHFSKRYLTVPVFQEYNHQKISCAFDFMKVRLNELHLLPHFMPVLKYLFQEEVDNHLEKSSNVVSFENVFLKTYRSYKTKREIDKKNS